jgi:pectate lyase-like protein
MIALKRIAQSTVSPRALLLHRKDPEEYSPLKGPPQEKCQGPHRPIYASLPFQKEGVEPEINCAQTSRSIHVVGNIKGGSLTKRSILYSFDSVFGLLISKILICYSKMDRVSRNNWGSIMNGKKVGLKNWMQLIVWLSIILATPFKILGANRNFPTGLGVINVQNHGVQTNDVNAADSIQKLIRDCIGKNLYLYFPKGTYLITKQLEWRGPLPDNDSNWDSGIHIIGENRDSTIFQVPANTLGFNNVASAKAVFYMASQKGSYKGGLGWTGGGDSGFMNFISNLTISIGTGNAGAIGIDFVGNNVCGVMDVTIKTSGGGYIGINMQRDFAGPGIIKNFSIEGFQYGLRINKNQSNMTLENVTLTNQSICGIRNEGSLLFVRKLFSFNSKPAIINARGHAVAYMSLIDATLDSLNGVSSDTAISSNGGGFFRNISIKGHRVGLVCNSIQFPGMVIPELAFSSDSISGNIFRKPIFSKFSSPQQSLALPIEETPEYFDTDTSHWLNVVDSGATPLISPSMSNADNSDAINKALSSGKSTIYFPPGIYYVKKTLTVGPAVKHIIGNGAVISPIEKIDFGSSSTPKPLFHFSNNSNDLRIENLEIGKCAYSTEFDSMPGLILFKHTSTKTLTLAHIRMVHADHQYSQHIKAVYEGGSGCGKLFLENVFSSHFSGWNFSPGQQVWARQFNVEGDRKNIVNNGGVLWVLGLKSENEATIIETKSAGGPGKTELIGGRLFTNGSGGISNPAFINDESIVSLSYYQSAAGDYYENQVTEIRGGSTRTLVRSDIYTWNWDSNSMQDSYVPLYVGYRKELMPFQTRRVNFCQMQRRRFLTKQLPSQIPQ